MELSGLHIGKKYIYWGSQCCKNCFIGECLAGKVDFWKTPMVLDIQILCGTLRWKMGSPAGEIGWLGHPTLLK